MFSDNTKRKIRRSLIAASLIYLIVAFGFRCFPLGCVVMDWIELSKILAFIGVPSFALVYIIMEIIQRNKKNEN